MATLKDLMAKDKEGQEGAGKDLGNKGFQPPCPVCELPFTSGKVTVDGVDFHEKCFSCHKCFKKLKISSNPLENYRKLQDGEWGKKYYCGPCIDSTTLYTQWAKENPDSVLVKDKKGSEKKAGMMCYLTYETGDNGVLFTNWSESPIAGAMAAFTAGKPVPQWKITQNGGKKELRRKCGPMFPESFHTGITSFIKMAQTLDGAVTLLAEEKQHNMAVYLHDPSCAFVRMKPTETYTLEKVDAVVSVPRLFNMACSTMERSLFVATGVSNSGMGLNLP